MAKQIVWGADLYKGFKLDKSTFLNGSINDILPFQMLTLEEKSIDWIHSVADFYEVCGWNNVERKAARIQKNYWMRYGHLNQSDYIVNPDLNEYAGVVSAIMPPQSQSPLQQFYPIAPNFVDILRGEFIKRDNTWTVEAVDPYSVSEAFEDKRSQFESILMQQAMSEKDKTLASLGITKDTDPQKYMQDMQSYQNQLTEVELKSKNFRTTGIKWAEKVLKIHEKRYNLHELEPDGFECGLITDSEFWHIDMLEDDFKIELLNPKYCDYHKGPNVKYVSEGDYFLWFDFLSIGDVINKFGRRMKEEDIRKLKDLYIKTANIIVPDQLKGKQGEYYDASKPWAEATDRNPAMNDALLGKELAYSFMRSPNFDHNMETDIFNPIWGRHVTGHPQMFRVMRLYWRSLKRIGFLTKIDKDGTIHEPTWVDENFKVTIDPVYDKSLVKEETKDNLTYGEHIDWTWVPEWRHVMKISPNQKHTFWMNIGNTFQSVYVDGGPIPFQFKGKNNPFEALPPVEGCSFSYLNTLPHSFIDRIKPLQIIYNLCMNKIPRKFMKDYGSKIAIDRRIMSTNHPGNTGYTIDPVEAYDDKLRESDILDYTLSRDVLDGAGTPALPQVLQLSTIQEAQMYMQLGQQIRFEAGELIGITRQRLGAQKAYETATGVQQGITYSETQTEKYYEQHSNLMERFRQRMIDAAQYFSTFNPSNQDTYMNEMDERIFLDIEGAENLLPHYNIYLQSKANVRAALQTISQFLVNENTLPISPSAKIEALVSNSIPKILTLIKTSENEQIQRELQAQEQDNAIKQQQLEMQQQMAAANMAHEDQQKELDRQNQKDIAMIRALGGLQSDNNKDGVIDAQQNLMNQAKIQEMQSKNNIARDQANAKKQADTDKMLIEREKGINELEKEKLKGEYALKVAEKNKGKYDK